MSIRPDLWGWSTSPLTIAFWGWELAGSIMPSIIQLRAARVVRSAEVVTYAVPGAELALYLAHGGGLYRAGHVAEGVTRVNNTRQAPPKVASTLSRRVTVNCLNVGKGVAGVTATRRVQHK